MGFITGPIALALVIITDVFLKKRLNCATFSGGHSPEAFARNEHEVL